MDDPFEMLIIAIAKKCDITNSQARNIVDMLERLDFLDMDAVEDHYMKEHEL